MATSLTGYSFDVEDNTGPRAIITPAEQTVVLGSVTKLDGRASFDTATNPSGILNYTWRFVRVPIGSQVEKGGFSSLDPDDAVVSFAPDITGFYEIGLVVDDGSISSPEFVASAEVQVIQVPNNQGIIPDASFIWDYLSDFWARVEGRERFEVLWSSTIQVLSAELLKLYQYDYNKSIKDIQPLFQKRWIHYSPELEVDRTALTGILAEDQAGLQAATVVMDSKTGVALEDQPDFFNLVTVPASEGNFSTTSFDRPVTPGRLLTVAGRSYTMSRSSSGVRSVNQGVDGSTTAAGNSFFGSGFSSDVVDHLLIIIDGADSGTYLISAVIDDTEITVTTTESDPVSFASSGSNLSYSIIPRTNNQSNFFASRKEIPTTLGGQAWRFSSTLQSSAQDFELQGVQAGDVLEVEIQRIDLSLFATLRLHVTGVDRNRVAFVFNRLDLEDGVPSKELSEKDIETLADELQVTGLSRDVNGVLQYSLEADVIRSFLSSKTFKRKYFETVLTSEDEIDIGPFRIKAVPKRIIRNSKLRVDSDLHSIPMLQEYIRQPDIAEQDGSLYLISRSGALVETDHRPHVLSENLDYVLDDESQIRGIANITQNDPLIEIPRGDLIDRRIAPGDTLTLTVGVTTQVYTISRVVDPENVEVIPTPSETAANTPFVLRRRVKGKFLRFVEGSFTKDSPAPRRLWAEVSFFSNDPQIEANFGVLVGVRKEDLERRVVSTPYLDAVSGLMFALSNGPVQENLKLTAQILLGLPFALHEGVITEINPEFRLREDGSPQFGRILVDALDSNGNQRGITNIYLYPQGRQILDEDSGEFIPATPNEAGIAINPTTGVEYVVGDVVEQFAVLSKGVSVDDYLSSPSIIDQLTQQGSLSSLLSQYHSLFLKINADITTPADVDFAVEFLKEVKPTHILFQAGIQRIIEDIIDVEDALIFGRSFEFFDNHHLSLPTAVKFDPGVGDGHFISFEGVMYSRYYTGSDLVTLQGSTSMTSATGGFVSPLPGQSFDSPLLRGEDLLIISGGPNAGKYDVESVTDDNTLVIDLTGKEVETAAGQEFRVYRPLKNPIFECSVSRTQGLSTVTIEAGGYSAGIAVGDLVTFSTFSQGIPNLSRKYRIIRFDSDTPEVELDTPIEEPTDTANMYIWREGLTTRYFLNQEEDEIVQVDLMGLTSPPGIRFDLPTEEERRQVGFLAKGDKIIHGDVVYTILDFDPINNPISNPTNIFAYVTPALPAATTEQQMVKIVREGREEVPITFELLDRIPSDLLTLSLLLPVGGQDLLTTDASTDVSTVSGENFEGLGVIPGDFLVVLEGADSSRDIGYGEGVFPILELPTSTTARLTRALTETHGSPGIRYGFQRRKSL